MAGEFGKRFWEAILSNGTERLIGERLQSTIDVIADHAALVELWASALSGFAQPIPPYELDKYRLGARRS